MGKIFSMTTKTKTMVATALVISAVALIPITVQHLANANLRAALDSTQQDLAALKIQERKEETALHAAQVQLETGAPAAWGANGSGPGSVASAGASSDTLQVQLDKEILKKIGFHSFNGFELTDAVRALLGITPDESARLQAVLDELQKRIQTHDAANTKEISLNDLSGQWQYNAFVAQVGHEAGGQISVYDIAPNPDGEAIQSWLGQNVGAILGDERGAIFMDHANDTVGMMVGSGQDRIVVFRDTTKDGQTSTQWWSYYGGNISGNNGNESVPQEFQYLFQPNGQSANGTAAAP
jgi:hypothetical protein